MNSNVLNLMAIESTTLQSYESPILFKKMAKPGNTEVLCRPGINISIDCSECFIQIRLLIATWIHISLTVLYAIKQRERITTRLSYGDFFLTFF